MTRPTRRAFLAGVSTIWAMPGAAIAGESVRRVFSVWRNGSDIGRHSLEARLTGRGFEIEIEINIAVTLLGFTAYRYELSNREVWAGRQIQSVDSRGNDDGERTRCRIARADGGLEIDGSGHSGAAPLEAVTTSYYAPAFLERRPWISTQSGRPLTVSVDARGNGQWAVSGDLEKVITYRDGEWAASAFTTEGERITYQTMESTGAITPLWRQA